MTASILGSLMFTVPAVLVAWVGLWRRNRIVFWFAMVLIVVGTGYLNATGATRDLAALLPLPADAPAR
jgi:dipeptide/tripeptide permease